MRYFSYLTIISSFFFLQYATILLHFLAFSNISSINFREQKKKTKKERQRGSEKAKRNDYKSVYF